MSGLTLEVVGQWWLAECPDRKVPGTLTFSPAAGGKLTLIGALRTILEEGERTTTDGTVTISITEAAMQESGQYPRILGEAANSLYTLEDCFRIRSSNILFGSQSSETIYVNRVLKGAVFERGEALEATGVTFGTHLLGDWVAETGISEEWTWPESNAALTSEPQFRLEARNLPERHVVCARGDTVRLEHRVGIRGDDISERCLSQRFFWRVDSPGKVGIDILVDLAGDLQDLVSVATNHPAAFRFMNFWHPDLIEERHDGTPMPIPISLYVRWNVHAEGDQRRLHEHDLLFTFREFDGIGGVGRWMDIADKHRASLGRVMASRHAEGMFASDRLLNCTAALEAFDRVRARSTKRATLKTRLHRCVSVAGAPFTALVGDVDAWVNAVIIERDDVAHNLGLRAHTTSTETHDLWQSLYWLFIICMLRESGAPAAALDHLQRHSTYRWLRPRIQVAVRAVAPV